MPRMMSVASYPVEILQTPGQITIITEAFSEVRRVFMDQPQLPIDEVPPGYYGHSVGRWDGDTLVIDTVGIKESVPGYQNMPHSDQMRITERIRLVTPDVLHDQITIEDPVVLEKPVTYTLAYRQMPRLQDGGVRVREQPRVRRRARARCACGSAAAVASAVKSESRLRHRDDDQDHSGHTGSQPVLIVRLAAAQAPAAPRRSLPRRRSARWRRRTWPSRGRSRRSI